MGPTADHSCARLPGLSASRLVMRGYAAIFLGAAFIVPIAFSSSFRPYAGLVAALSWVVMAVLAVLGNILVLHGFRKKDQEIARGYTSWLNEARKAPALQLVDSKSLTPIAIPAELR